MTNLINIIKTHKYFLIILIIATILRFQNLGYSDFQGDEIKALFINDQGTSNLQFLLDQRKGPIQFIITYLLKFFDPTYSNNFLIRLPFSIAGILSVVYFYKLIQNIYNEKIAFYASFFVATNGFLVAFSRIVQYQSFVILFMVAALYYLYKKNIYLGLSLWALSILSHYDGIFIFPLAFYFIYKYLIDINNKDVLNILNFKVSKNKLKNFIFAGLIATALLGVFYIPFVLNISDSTQDYWLGRISGDVSSKISSSRYLFSVYQPIYVIHIYLALFALGFLYVISNFIFKNKNLLKVDKVIKRFLPKSLFDKVKNLFNGGNIEFNQLNIVNLIWLVIPLLFLEAIVYIPGTHIYTYIIPAIVFMGIALYFADEIFKLVTITKTIFISATIIVFSFIFLQSYAIYVDNTYEYPYEEEKFLTFTFNKPTPIFHLSIFGFPYFRNWEDIGKFIKEYPTEVTHYSTNERKSISRYHIDFEKDTSDAGFYVHIRNPQSFDDKLTNEKVIYWSEKYAPVYKFTKDGRDLVNIYLMEEGELEEIIEKGF